MAQEAGVRAQQTMIHKLGDERLDLAVIGGLHVAAEPGDEAIGRARALTVRQSQGYGR